MRKLIFTSISLCLFIFSAFGQNRVLRYADQQAQLGNTKHAAEQYTAAYSRKADFNTARKVAQSYDQLNAYQEAFDWWGKVVTDERAEQSDYYNYLLAAAKAGQGEAVKEKLETGSLDKEKLEGLSLDLAERLATVKPKVKLVGADELNSDGSDFSASFDQEGNIYFTSDRGPVQPIEKKSIRLDAKNKLYSKTKNDFNDREYFGLYRLQKGELQNLTVDIEDALQVSDLNVSEDGSSAFYTVFRDVDKIKGNREYAINPEIYYAYIQDGTMVDSKPFPLNDFVSYGVQHPFFDQTNGKLYFSSDMPGGYGGFDLYVIDFDGEQFGEAINLGPNINTDKNEAYPSFYENMLYFSSNGHPGIGGLDIFTAPLLSEGQFGPVENMGLPYNSPQDDFAYRKDSNGLRYMSSDREGGMGLDDIYLIENLYKLLLAEVVGCDGNIFRSEYEVTLLDRASDELIGTERNDVGQLLAELPLDSDFWLKISKRGHFSIYDSLLSTKGLEADTLYREYLLAPIPYNLPVAVDIVYYDLDKSQIRKDASPVLDKIAELMQRHDFLDLSVASHTDSRASNAYNEALSQRRADAVRDYLSDFGISPERVKINWFGEEKLVNDCGDGVPCAENKHQLNRRSELVLEAFTDPEREYELPADLLKDICDLGNLPQKLQEELRELPTIYFDFDKDMLRAVHQAELERVALMLKNMPKLQLYLAGHTDQRGGSDYNMGLAERRAKAVLDYLVQRGVEKGRIGYEWFGKTQPIHDCDVVPCDEAMHQLNRRTEVRWGSEIK